MNLLDRVRESSFGSWAVAIGVYLVAAAGALCLRWATPGSRDALVAGALLMSGALIVTALVMRSPSFPRWSLVAAAAILAAGLMVPALLASGAPAGSRHPIGTGSYGWFYLLLLGGTPAAGPRGCHSPWTVVGAAVALTLGAVAARGLL